jgi:hypothetical protein
MKLARGAAPATARVALDHHDFQAAARKRRRRGKSFRARADDACVVSHVPPPCSPRIIIAQTRLERG